jgi:hypothetical protein
MAAEAWAPALDDVGRHIPTRTRDTDNPGDDELLGTFTTRTTPTADQVQPIIDAAVAGVLSRTGPLDATDGPLLDAARTAAEWRAAADIELAYPNRDADVIVYAQLDARAKYELDTLLRRLQGQGEGFAESVPFWSAPDPSRWADRDPDDLRWPPGTRYWSGADPGPI